MKKESDQTNALEEQKRQLLKNHQGEINQVLTLLRTHLKKIKSAGDPSYEYLAQSLTALINSYENIMSIPPQQINFLEFIIKTLSATIKAYSIQEDAARDSELVKIYNSLTLWWTF